MMPIQLARIEAWTLEIAQLVDARLRVEDSRVELKRDWIDPQKAARRLAGHANAGRGAEILWIVGLDEEAGVVGCPPKDLAEWWPSVVSAFDGVAPSLTDLSVPYKGLILRALHFETSRLPFVVKNPAFGASAAGSMIACEVPWRDGTRVRTARREELLQILVPVASLPDVEILEGHANLSSGKSSSPPHEATFHVRFTAVAYIVPRHTETVVIPFHRCRGRIRGTRSGNEVQASDVRVSHPYGYMTQNGPTPDTATMEVTSRELIIHGPGQCSISVNASGFPAEAAWLIEEPLVITAEISVVRCPVPVVVSFSALPEGRGTFSRMNWQVCPLASERPLAVDHKGHEDAPDQ